MLKCKFCSKECKNDNSLRNHERCCPSNPNRNYKNGMTGKAAWNKGLTKADDARLFDRGEKLKNKYASGELSAKNKISEEGLAKLSSLAKERKLGGYRPHPNKGVRYNGIWMDSKWEEKVAISLDANNIAWVRPRDGFVWSDTGRRYYPDFYLPEFNIYLDPKNSFLQKKDAEKIKEAMKRNNILVFMLNEDQLEWNAIKELLMVRHFGTVEDVV